MRHLSGAERWVSHFFAHFPIGQNGMGRRSQPFSPHFFDRRCQLFGLGIHHIAQQQIGRQFAQEERGTRRFAIPIQAALTGIGDEQALFSAGDADVAKAALLFQRGRIIQRTEVGKQSLLHPDQENHGKLQSFRGMEGHERDGRLAIVQVIEIRG